MPKVNEEVLEVASQFKTIKDNYLNSLEKLEKAVVELEELTKIRVDVANICGSKFFVQHIVSGGDYMLPRLTLGIVGQGGAIRSKVTATEAFELWNAVSEFAHEICFTKGTYAVICSEMMLDNVFAKYSNQSLHYQALGAVLKAGTESFVKPELQIYATIGCKGYMLSLDIEEENLFFSVIQRYKKDTPQYCIPDVVQGMYSFSYKSGDGSGPHRNYSILVEDVQSFLKEIGAEDAK